ncbi:hypothetical protein JOQ06_001027 [Pogonophryne albipinna]|uniref:Uncharacterized protein n=1 Tax=Pogonophryne albipinna TaxID=1090488 RepID=A0AAD6B490_9TELE|nr:hypothetical protein JOQ06_001027 [Pogonophryne albipinna]
MSPEQTAGRRTDRICTADACVELQMRCLGPPSGVKPLRTKPRGTMVKPDSIGCSFYLYIQMCAEQLRDDPCNKGINHSAMYLELNVKHYRVIGTNTP